MPLCHVERIDGALTCACCGVPFSGRFEVTEEDLAKIGGRLDRIRRPCGMPLETHVIDVGADVPPPSVQASPSPARKLLNFSLAAIRHIVEGMPTCTQQEIDERLAACQACDLYIPNRENPEVGVCSHKHCGCAVMREAKFVSKLAWRDQKCPLGKWPDL